MHRNVGTIDPVRAVFSQVKGVGADTTYARCRRYETIGEPFDVHARVRIRALIGSAIQLPI